MKKKMIVKVNTKNNSLSASDKILSNVREKLEKVFDNYDIVILNENDNIKIDIQMVD